MNQPHHLTRKASDYHDKGGNASVLIVDGYRPLCQLLQEILNNSGYQTTTCGCGEEALALCRNNSYDIILMDSGIPGFNGLAVLSEISRCEPGCALIVISSDVTSEVATAAWAAGASACLQKPFDIEKLLETIREPFAAARGMHARGKGRHIELEKQPFRPIAG